MNWSKVAEERPERIPLEDVLEARAHAGGLLWFSALPGHEHIQQVEVYRGPTYYRVVEGDVVSYVREDLVV